MVIHTRITAEEYYQLPEYTEHDLIQLIEGEVFAEMPPIPFHQTIVGNIFVMLWNIAKSVGGRAYDSPIEVYFDDHNIYQPDVLFLLPESRCTVEEKRLSGPPDLVVEVLSPSTAKYDRDQKFKAYERHGVTEYWIADPSNRYLEVWTLDDSAYKRLGVFIEGDSFDSVVLKQKVDVTAIFDD